MKKNRAVFLDRDGVINKCILRNGKLQAPYEIHEFEFLPGVREGIELLKSQGFLIIVVTNQPDVSRGWVPKENVEAVNAKVKNDLNVLSIKTCYHDTYDDCACRKPKPGMILEAAGEFNINLSESFLMGDRYTDIAAGSAAGLKASILIGVGDTKKDFPEASFKTISLLEGADWIVKGLPPSP